MSEKKSLQEILGDELFTQVNSKLGEVKIGIVNDGSYIPKGKFDDLLTEIKGYKEEIKTRDGQLDELKKSLQGNEELTNKITELETKNEEWSGKLAAAKKEFQVKMLATSFNAHDVNDILKLVDLETLTLDDNGDVKGVEEALNKIKEDKPYFFKQEQQEEPQLGGRTPQNLKTPPKPELTKEQFKTMGYTERVNLLNSNPELYKQLNG